MKMYRSIVFTHLDRMVVKAESKPMFNFRLSINAKTKSFQESRGI